MSWIDPSVFAPTKPHAEEVMADINALMRYAVKLRRYDVAQLFLEKMHFLIEKVPTPKAREIVKRALRDFIHFCDEQHWTEHQYYREAGEFLAQLE